MKNKFVRTKCILVSLLLGTCIMPAISSFDAWAAPSDSVGFTLSPLREDIVLNPGEAYKSSFKVSNPGTQTTDIKYEVDVQAFYVDENYKNVFGENTSRNMITEWIKIDSPTSGTLSPNESTEILYTINVPNDAPAGGQYADIRVVSAAYANDDSNNNSEGGSTLGEKIAIGHLVYAEITGATIRQGEILDANVSSFLLSGNITGTSSIKNTGNVHAKAKYVLQVYPLFSDEEVYTNEEDPDTKTILPDRTLYNETAWDNTPAIGIFNVVYTVEFEGVTAQVKKMVIKCPVWLLFIILFAIIALIIWIFLKVNKRRNAKRER